MIMLDGFTPHSRLLLELVQYDTAERLWAMAGDECAYIS